MEAAGAATVDEEIAAGNALGRLTALLRPLLADFGG